MGTEHAWLKTKLGWIQVQVHEAGLVRLTFLEGKPPAGEHAAGPLAGPIVALLERYFAGELSAIDGVAVAPKGTVFQLSVWRELRKVPVGELVSYAELAERVGKPRAVRAVGQANAKNPVAIVVPCHRVVASDGALGGYSAGGDRKAWLLTHERVEKLTPKPRARRVAKSELAQPDALPLFEALAPQSQTRT